MNLYRLKIKPLSAWRTPWEADTLAGILCREFAYTEGADELQNQIIKPALLGDPPFILSNAFPGDFLPMPEFVRACTWPLNELKAVKQAKWLSLDAFRRVQTGAVLSLADLSGTATFQLDAHVHNTLDRLTDTTSGGGLSIFTQDEYWLNGADYLSLYVRLKPEFEDTFLRLMTNIAAVGYGADKSSGKGQFELLSGLESAAYLERVTAPNATIVLSAFQPSTHDPTEGGWQISTKYGKLANDFGIAQIFKRPMLMLRAGAYFYTDQTLSKVGRAIAMHELLAPDACDELNARGISIAQLAFGLTVPAQLNVN